MRTRCARCLARRSRCSPRRRAAAERADREKEIVVGADRLTADDANRTSTFEGNVVVTQGTMRITAAQGHGEGGRASATSSTSPPARRSPSARSATRSTSGSRAWPSAPSSTTATTCSSSSTSARVKSNQNEITGDFISYDMKREVAEVSGAPPGQPAPPNSRVKVIIMPPKKARGRRRTSEGPRRRSSSSPTPGTQLDGGHAHARARSTSRW